MDSSLCLHSRFSVTTGSVFVQQGLNRKPFACQERLGLKIIWIVAAESW